MSNDAERVRDFRTGAPPEAFPEADSFPQAEVFPETEVFAEVPPAAAQHRSRALAKLAWPPPPATELGRTRPRAPVSKQIRRAPERGVQAQADGRRRCLRRRTQWRRRQWAW